MMYPFINQQRKTVNVSADASGWRLSMIDQMLDAALAPFASQVGWQGFAYGLLGIETIKRSVRAAIDARKGGGDSE